MKPSLQNCKEPIAYVVFGVLSTLVNIAVYYLFSELLGIHYMISNVVAWTASVSVAFITNKLFVFGSKSLQRNTVLVEIGSFFLARVATGLLDMLLMWLFVDVLVVEEMLAKVVVNVVVIILNYVASKLWVFK